MDFNWKPQGLDLKQGYNNNVNNTGNYGLPTQNVGFGQAESNTKPLGDYSFTKDSSAYVPNTEFAQGIAEKAKGLTGNLKTGLADALTNFAGGNSAPKIPQIGVTGFNPVMAQINPAQMVQLPQQQTNISNLYNRLMY